MLSMEIVSKEYQQQLDELATMLVTPERYAAPALAPVVQLELVPEPEAAIA